MVWVRTISLALRRCKLLVSIKERGGGEFLFPGEVPGKPLQFILPCPGLCEVDRKPVPLGLGDLIVIDDLRVCAEDAEPLS
jgi:hypothetical protein